MKSIIAGWIVSAIAVLGFAVPAFASSGENSGVPSKATIVPQSNGADWYEFTLGGLGTLCPGRNWAYISSTDFNFGPGMIGAFGGAVQDGSNLYIYWTTDASGNCHVTRLYY